MYRMTRFGDLMKGLPRAQFDRVVSEQQADKFAKGFSRWDQFLAMVFSQVSGCRSLREVESGFNCQANHHYHLGTRPVKRSTLSDSNAHRDCGLYKTLCEQLIASTHRKVKRQMTQMLYLLDSTPIILKGLGYDDWSQSHRTHRTQGLKVHMLYSPATATPAYLNITAPNVLDVHDAAHLTIESGATYVFDKGYCHYNWWHELDCANAQFVTRFKSNAALVVQQELEIPEADRHNILADQRVHFAHRNPGGKVNRYTQPLRRVIVARPGTTPLVLATNDMARSAQQIADLYKARWDIELFFKWLKQNLKIKRFLGRSDNAVRTQIYIAIITYLLILLYRRRHGLKDSLKLCAVVLSGSLFQRPEVENRVYERWRKDRDTFNDLQPALPI